MINAVDQTIMVRESLEDPHIWLESSVRTPLITLLLHRFSE